MSFRLSLILPIAAALVPAAFLAPALVAGETGSMFAATEAAADCPRPLEADCVLDVALDDLWAAYDGDGPSDDAVPWGWALIDQQIAFGLLDAAEASIARLHAYRGYDRSPLTTIRLLATAHLQAGNPERAVELVRAIPEDEARVGALAALADALDRPALLEEALEIARARGDGTAHERLDQAELLLQIIAETDNPAPADALLALYPWRWTVLERDFALAMLIELDLDAGRIDRARQVARKLWFPYLRNQAYVGIGLAELEAGRIDQASRLVSWRYVLSRALRDELFADVATERVLHGDAERGLRDLARVRSSEVRGARITELIGVVSDPDLLSRLETAAMDLSDRRWRNAAVHRLAERFQADGQTDRALALADSIGDGELRARLLLGVVGAGDADSPVPPAPDPAALQAALAAADAIENEYQRSVRRLAALEAMAEAGRDEPALAAAALAAAHGAPDPFRRMQGQRMVGGVLGDAQALAAARDYILTMTGQARDQHLEELAQAQARAGLVDDAFETRDLIEDRMYRHGAEAQIMRVVRSRDDPELLLAATRHIEFVYTRYLELRDLALRMVAAGDVDRGFDLARENGLLSFRLQALNEIALALPGNRNAEAGRPPPGD